MSTHMDVPVNDVLRTSMHSERQFDSTGGFDQQGKHHSKNIIKFAVPVIIIALVAAVVFQSISGNPEVRFQGFTEEYCISLLTETYPGAAEAVYFREATEGRYTVKEATHSGYDIFLYTQGNRVAACKVSSVQYSSVNLDRIDNEYECQDRTIRYRYENKANHNLLVIESELSDLVVDGVVVLDSSDLPKYTIETIYINPVDRDYWQDYTNSLSIC